MRTKTIALIIAFSTIAVVLNPTISRLAVPVFYIPNTNLVYQFFEIPIIIALLLLGLKSGLVVAAINSIALVFLYPGRTFLYPISNFVAVTSMMIGIATAILLYNKRVKKGTPLKGTKIILFSTALGIAFRIAAMTPVWYGLFIISYPTLSVAFFLTRIVPLEAIFNATLPLYTIPIAYLIAGAVKKNLTIGDQVSNRKCPETISEKGCEIRQESS